jgi:hypothetical protein
VVLHCVVLDDVSVDGGVALVLLLLLLDYVVLADVSVDGIVALVLLLLLLDCVVLADAKGRMLGRLRPMVPLYLYPLGLDFFGRFRMASMAASIPRMT